MRSTYDEFLKESAEVRTLIDSIHPVNEALAVHADSVVRQYLTVRRRFDYAAFVVALYASFEKFAENLVRSLAQTKITKFAYAALPPALTKKHLTKSAEILYREYAGKGRYSSLREADIVKNLSDCLSGAPAYSLNEWAVTHHESNLRPDEINTLFSTVGIDSICEKSRKTDAVVDWYKSRPDFVDMPESGVPYLTIKTTMEDLVERRNGVAHRGGSPDSLLGHEKMSDLLKFVEAFSRGLYTLCVEHYLRESYIDRPGAISLGTTVEGPYAGGRAVVVGNPGAQLVLSQPAFALSEGWVVRWGRVQSLRIDDVPVNFIDSNCPDPLVGMLMDFRVSDGAQIYLLPAEDDLIWDPSGRPSPPVEDSQPIGPNPI